MKFFATTARGMEDLLAGELRECGAGEVEIARAGVAFQGTLDVAYRACLWSRVASRVLLPLASFRAATPQVLYDRVRRIRWHEHLGPQQTLAVDCTSSESQIDHSHFGALKTKDAIVDQIRDKTGARPSIDARRPDVRVNLYLYRDEATLSIDLSGDSLHRRGYREERGVAPLKENVAAAMLLLAGWPQLARDGAPFVDPMCGSGTLPIEAAFIAANMAPGALRSYYGFTGWLGHDAALWKQLQGEAQEGIRRDRKELPAIIGYDHVARAVQTALRNVERAGLRAVVHIEKRTLDRCEVPQGIEGDTRGVLATNPPYGQRLGDETELVASYRQLGDVLRRRFLGWRAFVLTGNARLAKSIGLRPLRRHILYNGALECRLLEIPISHTPVVGERQPQWRQAANTPTAPPPTAPRSAPLPSARVRRRRPGAAR
jgi:23S rRNA (guanine2445-N2)-methyltransferase / 23S rRNA (guanine2069-N7)-methyltransferase